ncbi:Cyclin-dependent protein kinase inhibitor SMR3 [Linum grandiflorum]
MSAHLDSLPDLPKIRLLTQDPTEEPSTSGSSVDDGSHRKPENYGDDECRTPKSAEFKIPAMLKCPPAPRKPKARPATSCKRKLMSELDFFEVVNREEVESFFRSGLSKRRCPDLVPM